MQLGLNGLAGQETQGQRSPAENVTEAVGAIPGSRQVLADLRGALPGDCGEKDDQYPWKAQIQVGLPPPRPAFRLLGVGGLLVGL